MNFGGKTGFLIAVLAMGMASPGANAAVPSAVAANLRARAVSHGAVRVIVQFAEADPAPPGSSPAVRQGLAQNIEQLQQALAQRAAQPGLQEVTRFRFIPFMVFSADANALDTLANLPEVIDLQEDIPEYPLLASSIPVIGANAAWAAGYAGTGQVIAILDTGVDTTHPFFPAWKLKAEACFSTNDPNATPNKSSSVCPEGASSSTAAGSGRNCAAGISGCDHGTHVAGIAVGNDGVGPNIGVARDAGLIAIQVFSCISSGADCSGIKNAGSYPSDQIRALEHVLALSENFTIAAVNMSLGGIAYTTQNACDAVNAARKAAIDNLRAVGIATIAASGNSNSRNSISQPGCISSAISVGNTTDADAIDSTSNVAPFLSLLAPGSLIDSSVPGGSVASKTGTSMAVPHVAGAWAVLRQAQPEAGIDEILEILRNTGTPVDDQRSGGSVTDMRRINLDLALNAMLLQPEFESTPVAGTELDFGSVFIGESSDFREVSISNSGGSALQMACQITGESAGSFQIQSCPEVVAAGQSSVLMLRCSPVAIGLKSAQFMISSNDADAPEASFPLSCAALMNPDYLFIDGFEEPVSD